MGKFHTNACNRRKRRGRARLCGDEPRRTKAEDGTPKVELKRRKPTLRVNDPLGGVNLSGGYCFYGSPPSAKLTHVALAHVGHTLYGSIGSDDENGDCYQFWGHWSGTLELFSLRGVWGGAPPPAGFAALPDGSALEVGDELQLKLGAERFGLMAPDNGLPLLPVPIEDLGDRARGTFTDTVLRGVPFQGQLLLMSRWHEIFERELKGRDGGAPTTRLVNAVGHAHHGVLGSGSGTVLVWGQGERRDEKLAEVSRDGARRAIRRLMSSLTVPLDNGREASVIQALRRATLGSGGIAKVIADQAKGRLEAVGAEVGDYSYGGYVVELSASRGAGQSVKGRVAQLKLGASLGGVVRVWFIERTHPTKNDSSRLFLITMGGTASAGAGARASGDIVPSELRAQLSEARGLASGLSSRILEQVDKAWEAGVAIKKIGERRHAPALQEADFEGWVDELQLSVSAGAGAGGLGGSWNSSANFVRFYGAHGMTLRLSTQAALSGSSLDSLKGRLGPLGGSYKGSGFASPSLHGEFGAKAVVALSYCFAISDAPEEVFEHEVLTTLDEGLETRREAFFCHDSAVPSPAATRAVEACLAKQANALWGPGGGAIEVHAYADGTGKAAYNQDLSDRRALAVKAIFEAYQAAGYLPTSVTIEATGHGEVEGSPQGGKTPAHRRVDIFVQGKHLVRETSDRVLLKD